MANEIQEEKSEKERMQDFVKAYNDLCNMHGYQLLAQPSWAATNHGSFELSILMKVVVKEKPNE